MNTVPGLLVMASLDFVLTSETAKPIIHKLMATDCLHLSFPSIPLEMILSV